MFKRNRGVISRYLFFGFLGLLLLLVATTPVVSQETTEPPIRYQLYFNDQLVAGTDVPATEFALDITDDGKLEPLHIKILGGTGSQAVYVHDFWVTVQAVQGAGSITRYPQQGNYLIMQTFPANQPDTVLFEQTVDVIAEAEAAGYDLPDPIYTGFIELTIFIRYSIGGPPPGVSSSAGAMQMTTMQVDAEGFETFEDSVDVNVQDHYVIEDGVKSETTSSEKLQTQLSTPAGQATAGVTAVAGIALVFAGLQAVGIFPSFTSAIPAAASLGPGSIFGTTNSLQNFLFGRMSREARSRVLYKMRRAITSKVRRMSNCPSCAAKWSRPDLCPGCGLNTAELINEYRSVLKGGSTKAMSLLAEGKKASVGDVATKLGTDPAKAADIMSVLTEAGLLNFGVAAAGTGATTAAGVAAGVAIPQWLNLTGIAPMNLFVMIGVAAIGVVLPLAWTKYSKKKQKAKYAFTEAEEVPEEIPAEDIEEMEKELEKASTEEVEASPEEVSEESPPEEE